MILFGQCAYDNKLMPTRDTNRFMVGLFGFFKHGDEDALEAFFVKELRLTTVKSDVFVLGKAQRCIVTEGANSKSFEEGYLLGRVFDTKAHAKAYILSEITHSAYVVKKMFFEIEILDADAVEKFLLAMNVEDKEESDAKVKVKEELAGFRRRLMQKYRGNTVMRNAIKAVDFTDLKYRD